MYEVVLANTARIAFEEAGATLQKKLDCCFEQLARQPRKHNNIKALKGRFAGYFRYLSAVTALSTGSRMP